MSASPLVTQIGRGVYRDIACSSTPQEDDGFLMCQPCDGNGIFSFCFKLFYTFALYAS